MPLGEYIDRMVVMDAGSYPYYLHDNYSLFVEHKDLWSEFSQPKYCYDWFRLLPAFMVRPGRGFSWGRGALCPVCIRTCGERTSGWRTSPGGSDESCSPRTRRSFCTRRRAIVRGRSCITASGLTIQICNAIPCSAKRKVLIARSSLAKSLSCRAIGRTG